MTTKRGRIMNISTYYQKIFITQAVILIILCIANQNCLCQTSSLKWNILKRIGNDNGNSPYIFYRIEDIISLSD